MASKTKPNAGSGVGTALNAVALLGLSLSLGACTGMWAPYPSRPIDGPDAITLIPITPDLVSSIRSDQPKQYDTSDLPLSGDQPYQYTIKAGDVLDVSLSPIVFFNSKNSNSLIGETGLGYTVYPEGTIYLPYAGPVQVAGLTPREAQTKVIENLSKFLISPDVLVTVRDFRSQRILLTGQIKDPGYVPITDVPLTLMGLLAQRGVLTEQSGIYNPSLPIIASSPVAADTSRVSLKRDGRDYVFDAFRVASSMGNGTDIVLLDGDILTVPPVRRGKIFVMGEVISPSLMEIDSTHTNLAEILLLAGGLDPITSKASRVYLIRGDLAHPTVYQLNAAAPDSFLLAQEFPLKPKDIVFVSPAGITRWNRFLQQLLPAVNGLVNTAVTAEVLGGGDN